MRALSWPLPDPAWIPDQVRDDARGVRVDAPGPMRRCRFAIAAGMWDHLPDCVQMEATA